MILRINQTLLRVREAIWEQYGRVHLTSLKPFHGEVVLWRGYEGHWICIQFPYKGAIRRAVNFE